ncbi:MAG TPA: Bug family tripartite tricarboxylate transporter substrate binding protein [Burkholderiaceae bacterium]|nr:Bug family tripartite tricarboxylate transporter substrate binding protein [Burkholderiaceae bacterium]
MLRILLTALALSSSAAAGAQDKPVRILVGFPAGAGLDAMTRMVAEKMRESLGQPVIVENRPGAGGRIVMDALKNSPADGSVLVMTPLVTIVTAPHVYPDLRYDAFKDFAPVAHTANFLFAYAVGPQVKATTLKEFVAAAKGDPQLRNYASAAPGSLPHFFSILFAERAGLQMNHIGYRGTAPALTDLIGGQIASFMGTVSDLAAQHEAGRIRILATSGDKRAPQLPNVPTFKEQGYDIEGQGWYALYAPAGTPQATIDRLAKAAIAAVQAPDVRDKLVGLGMEPTGLGPQELAKIHRRDYERWGPVIKASGFKPTE